MQTLLFIFIGLIGLSIIVVIHELGHLLAARLCKVEVEAFAIGWGKILWKWKPYQTEYRICLLPLGGYCKMKGEDFIRKSLEDPQEKLIPEKGSYFASSPLSRVVISFAGPLFNLLFAFLCFVILGLGGKEVFTVPPRVVLTSEVDPPSEAITTGERAGLRTGDLITQIDEKAIAHFYDLQEILSQLDKETIDLYVIRDGQELKLKVDFSQKKPGQPSYLGVRPWIDPIIQSMEPQSLAFLAGLKAGDRLISINEVPMRNTIDINKIQNSKSSYVTVRYLRDGQLKEIQLATNDDNKPFFDGVTYTQERYRIPGLSLKAALWASSTKTIDTIWSTAQGLGLLVTGQLKPNEALAGPLRITSFIGETTSQHFQLSWQEGISTLVNLLAFLSIALFFMNLLPLPALDGGNIMLSFVELVRRKNLQVKTLVNYQKIGYIILFFLVIFVTINDISHFFLK